MEQFTNYSSKSKETFSTYQPDLNYLDFWKRNLGYLVKCRSLHEVEKNEKIEKVGEIYQFYLSDYLQFLSYLIVSFKTNA